MMRVMLSEAARGQFCLEEMVVAEAWAIQVQVAEE